MRTGSVWEQELRSSKRSSGVLVGLGQALQTVVTGIEKVLRSERSIANRVERVNTT